jgi:hypothetical protein
MAVVAAGLTTVAGAAAVAWAVTGPHDARPASDAAPLADVRPSAPIDASWAAATAVEDAGARDASLAGAALDDAAPEANAAAAWGRVNLVARPAWAEVYVGRRRLGRTPTVATLPARTVTLSYRAEGQGPRRRARVQVRPGVTTQVVLPTD